MWHQFTALNAGYVAELYERYRRDPTSVDARTRAFFERFPASPDKVFPALEVRVLVGAIGLAQAVREYGHLAARLDPLGTPPPGDPSLTPGFWGITEEDLRGLPPDLVGGPVAGRARDALEALEHLRAIYSGTAGYEFEHLRVAEERVWLREAVEGGWFRPPQDSLDEVALLRRLTEVETFERFLHRAFPGKTRFSLEGLDILVPMLDEVIARAAQGGVRTVLLGMAHRGRLNVLAHVLGKPYRAILAEFKDPVRGSAFRDDLGWTGDVTYHKGARRIAPGAAVLLAPNPSHLEAITPVIEGMARAAGTRAGRAGAPAFDPDVVLPVLIHGDAAFCGQGVVAETLNLAQVPGYATGGTIHLIANNQLGYTTDPREGRSTTYASDLAKGFEIPVVHVNADDPETCIAAARLAVAYRMRFHKDFVIDLVGYRRWGHNEGDEPSFTQPTMYRRIERHPTVRVQWASRLVGQGVVEPHVPDQLVREHLQRLQAELSALEPERDLVEEIPAPPPPGAARGVRTAVPLERLRRLHEALLRVPEGFSLHPKLARALERRQTLLADPDAPTVDWAGAEQLAFASLLEEGIPIRLVGQDTERGTFGQRHAVFHDFETGAEYVPLQALPQARAAFEVHNTPLSENAVLAFEYGYSLQAPGHLVLWEAQYGDFLNNAQVVVDEFLVSARAKWGQRSSLVLLLPHGYEGQGPDHSSARPERFLALSADLNLRLAYPTTAAQYFHLLRRQALLLQTDPLPLIVLTPKGLLRHPATFSRPRDLSEGGWQPVMDDGADPQRVRRLLLCTGKIFVDLATSGRKGQEVAIVRLEQLYPPPEEELAAVLERYRGAEEIYWVQEEPQNMGAWGFLRPILESLLGGRPLRYVGRPPSPSPAEGSRALHAVVQEGILAAALGVHDAPGARR
ncbi:MAG: 2-oxoglutarate dehydrogenase E1 component [Armatimonadota bacterium]|nr:2-oxoglutarate dehydrogenase E1 component [Armatimonadota bacterium]MDR7443465.1 2-oxoglutarate dehydrogenase E1 component [Armatimonadota bacterium]MDR7569303.1 2-oxoglutarate dehydrogenase E1 component [Armatimonadota bacterium]MDR7614963.1 2-oxoglutarate dehydrogenase E1 component [Armatimonadota bacterium]